MDPELRQGPGSDDEPRLINNPWAAVESDSDHERQLDDQWARHLDEEEDDREEDDDEDEDEEDEEDDDDYEDVFHDAEDGEDDEEEDEDDEGRLLTPGIICFGEQSNRSHQTTERPWNSSSHQEEDKKAACKPSSAEVPWGPHAYSVSSPRVD